MNGGVLKNNIATNRGGGIFVVEGCVFQKSATGSETKSGIVYGGSAGDGIANIAKPSSGDAVELGLRWSMYCRDSTLGEYDEISTENVNVGWGI
jgi:predicted outer membrane repeat protein